MSRYIFIDIETLPDQGEGARALIESEIKPPSQMKKQETIDAWMSGQKPYEGVKDALVNEKYRKTSLNGDYGRIFCICIDIDGIKKEFVNDDEKALLCEFWQFISAKVKAQEKPFFVAHNADFDLTFLWKRSIINNVHPLIKRNARHGHDYFCTMQEWAGYKQLISLNNLSSILGVGSKTDGIDGSKVYDYWLEGKHDEIIEYCHQDVDLVKSIFSRINGVSYE